MAAVSPPPPRVIVERTLHQLCTSSGEPYPAYFASCLWVSAGDPYLKTDGNAVTPLTTGVDYYRTLASAIASATSTVYVLGWQINWDVMLAPGVRLYDALFVAVRKNTALKVYILPWKSSIGVYTGDADTEAVLRRINMQLAGPPRVFVTRALEHPDASGGFDNFFSHHQKQVVIDNQTAFVGGIDVCWGRLDDATYALDASARQGCDAYNGCVPHLATANAAEVDPALLTKPDTILIDGGEFPDSGASDAKRKLSEGAVQRPPDGKVLDASRQPRMPWQDVQLKIEGPAVSDLASNFVLRWNVANRSSQRLALPPEPKRYARPGTCSVQLLRSASDKMVALEGRSVSAADKPRVHDRTGHNSIYHAMVRLIEHADYFIYIENQFFVSAFGQERFGDAYAGPRPEPSPEVARATNFFKREATRRAPGIADAMPTNVICEALGTKIRDFIVNTMFPSPDGENSPFHVYITLPVHPEGQLDDAAVMTQVHWTMQTLVHGSQSLLNHIRRSIRARQLLDAKDKAFERVYADQDDEYKKIPVDACWPYVTLLNLRNWAVIGGHHVTEQIYVHTKMMIVDDCYAIVGSANINDRSQLGNRDSELAVLVIDNQFEYIDIGAEEGPTVTRTFARNLRIQVWNKIFGNTGGVRPAGLKEAIERPAAQKSWKAIRSTAELNSKRYEAAFPFIPSNGHRIWGGTGSLEKAYSYPTASMPFDPAFWEKPIYNAAAAANLNLALGYITLLPWQWTAVDGVAQNNCSGMHGALFVQTEPESGDETEIASVAAKKTDGVDEWSQT